MAKTNTKTHYTTPGSNNLRIPSRQEFQRYRQNDISQSDFCTQRAGDAGRQASKVASAIRWTIVNSKNLRNDLTLNTGKKEDKKYA